MNTYGSHSQIRVTLAYLRRCIAARAKGQHVSYTTDPAWLVMQAINRKAGWPQNPGCERGTCFPVRRNPNKERVWGSPDHGRYRRPDSFTLRRGRINLTAAELYGRYPAVEYPKRAVGPAISRFPGGAR